MSDHHRAVPEPTRDRPREHGWCPACRLPCFVLYGTCRGCGSRAETVTEMAARVAALTAERDGLRAELRTVLDACRAKAVRLEPTDDDDVFDEVLPPWWMAANAALGR